MVCKLQWVTSAGLGSAAAADMIMAGALSYYLLKSRTGFKQYVSSGNFVQVELDGFIEPTHLSRR